MPDPLAFVNAEIHTSDSSQPHAEGLLIEGSRIVAVGEERAIIRKARAGGARLTDVGGRIITPGLIDAHTHLIHQGLLRHRLDLRDTRSLEEALGHVRTRLRRHPARELLLAERWDESRWKERHYPTRADLDALSRDVPIILRRVDGHVAVANEAACRLLEGRVAGVHLDTGLLVEEASLNLNQLFPTPAPTAIEALRLAQDQAIQLGVTTVHDFVVPPYLRAYQALHQKGQLRIRAHLSLYVEYLDALERAGWGRGWGDPRLQFAGVKLFADGSLGGHTAALHEPYHDEPGTGRLNWTDAALQDVFRRADAADLQISAHAIGDAAIDQVAHAYEALPRTARRRGHRIEHYELHTDASIATVRRAGLVASMQPNFVGEWSRPGGMYHRRLGSPRHRHNNEFGRLRRLGVPIAFGSDCMPFDPWFGLDACVHAPYPAQRLRFDQALEAYTRGSARSLGRDDLGVLKPKALADFLVLRLDPRRPAKAQVLQTFVEGRLVARRSASRRSRRGT